MGHYDTHAPLLARRVPLDEVEVGKVYVIHARNGGVGVAVKDENGRLGYRLHRVKFDRHYLWTEWDWDESDHDTAIPLRLLDAQAPEEDDELLAWLADREVEVADEVQAAWDVVLGR
ncbi:MAG: hypothetical protein ABIO70_26015 [Pseudomonadota bacterium]